MATAVTASTNRRRLPGRAMQHDRHHQHAADRRGRNRRPEPGPRPSGIRLASRESGRWLGIGNRVGRENWRHQAVAPLRHRLDVERCTRVIAERLAQLDHHLCQRIVPDHHPLPHRRQQHIPGHHLAGPPDQEHQHFHHLGFQANLLLAPPQQVQRRLDRPSRPSSRTIQRSTAPEPSLKASGTRSSFVVCVIGDSIGASSSNVSRFVGHKPPVFPHRHITGSCPFPIEGLRLQADDADGAFRLPGDESRDLLSVVRG